MLARHLVDIPSGWSSRTACDVRSGASTRARGRGFHRWGRARRLYEPWVGRQGATLRERVDGDYFGRATRDCGACLGTERWTPVPDSVIEVTTADPVEILFRNCIVCVFLDCERLRVTIDPTEREYNIFFQYRDSVARRRVRSFAGPLSGTVEDPFGETSFVLLEAIV
jgi:hypothetical protein